MRDFSWESMWQPEVPPLEVIVRATIIYLFVYLVFRMVPRKELARYAISDIILLFLVTTAVRRSIVVDDNSLTTAIIGLGTIFIVDQILDKISRKGHFWSDLIQGRRIMLVRNGETVDSGLKHAKISLEELLSRLRGAGTQDLSKVECAYLERDGKVTFVFRR